MAGEQRKIAQVRRQFLGDQRRLAGLDRRRSTTLRKRLVPGGKQGYRDVSAQRRVKAGDGMDLAGNCVAHRTGRNRERHG